MAPEIFVQIFTDLSGSFIILYMFRSRHTERIFLGKNTSFHTLISSQNRKLQYKSQINCIKFGVKMQHMFSLPLKLVPLGTWFLWLKTATYQVSVMKKPIPPTDNFFSVYWMFRFLSCIWYLLNIIFELKYNSTFC